MRAQPDRPRCRRPHCYRMVAKNRGRPFCDKCWQLLHDDEQFSVMMSVHAPLWGRAWLRVEDECTVDGQAADTTRWGEPVIAVDGVEVPFVRFLVHMERETTAEHFGSIIRHRIVYGMPEITRRSEPDPEESPAGA